MKPAKPGPVGAIEVHAIQEQHVKVDVQVERTAKALDRGDRAGLGYLFCQARFRPIAMSTITTLCGLAPLVLIPGADTELYRGVGAIVMFGILGATIVTWTIPPALAVSVLEYQNNTDGHTE